MMYLVQHEPFGPVCGGNMTQETENSFKSLIEAAAAGSEDAVARIVNEYGYAILQVVRARLSPRLRRRFDSQDLVQVVWMSFFRHRHVLHQFGSADELIAWLKTMSANKVIDECRRSLMSQKRDARRERGVDTWRLHSLDAVASSRQTPSADLSRAEQLEALDPRQRRMVSLRLAGATHAEIAEELGVSEGTVRRAFRRLREREGE
jgi:RNA polymerase sigma factor (sigma-70 family)